MSSSGGTAWASMSNVTHTSPYRKKISVFSDIGQIPAPKVWFNSNSRDGALDTVLVIRARSTTGYRDGARQSMNDLGLRKVGSYTYGALSDQAFAGKIHRYKHLLIVVRLDEDKNSAIRPMRRKPITEAQSFPARLRAVQNWSTNSERGSDIVYRLKEDAKVGGRWSQRRSEVAGELGLREPGDTISGSSGDRGLQRRIEFLGDCVETIYLAQPRNILESGRASTERRYWTSYMRGAEWNVEDPSKGYVEFPNGEYSEWFADEGYLHVRWSCALSPLALVDRADDFFAQLDPDTEVFAKFEHESNRRMAFSQVIARARGAENELEYLRVDRSDSAILWQAADNAPNHSENEYGETTLVERHGQNQILDGLIRRTATPLVGAAAMSIAEQAVMVESPQENRHERGLNGQE